MVKHPPHEFPFNVCFKSGPLCIWKSATCTDRWTTQVWPRLLLAQGAANRTPSRMENRAPLGSPADPMCPGLSTYPYQ